MDQNIQCEKYLKVCVESDCKVRFVSKWCGMMHCERCLQLCWIMNESTDIMDKLFGCCPIHRPFVSDLLIEELMPKHLLPTATLPTSTTSKPIKIQNNDNDKLQPAVKSRSVVHNLAGSFKKLLGLSTNPESFHNQSAPIPTISSANQIDSNDNDTLFSPEYEPLENKIVANKLNIKYI